MQVAKRAKWSMAGLGSVVMLAAVGSWAMADRVSSVRADNAAQTVRVNLSLPLDAYQLSPQQQAEQAHLDHVITSTCMKSYGIAYLTNVPDVSERFAESSAVADSRRYGISDLSSARARGYHLPPEMGSGGNTTLRSSEDDLTVQQQLVLTGQPDAKTPSTFTAQTDTVGQYNGKAVPRGGCIGQAVRALREPMSTEAIQKSNLFAANLQQQIFMETQTQPKVLAVFKQWSTCMADRGFHYPDPIAAATDSTWQLNKPFTADEVRTAVADVECKQQTDLLRIEHQVEVSLQNAAIKQHATELAPLKKAVTDQDSAMRQAKAKYQP